MGFKQYMDKLRQGDTSLLVASTSSPSFQWQLVVNRNGIVLEAPRSLASRMGRDSLSGESLWLWPCWYEKGWELGFLKEALDDAQLGIRVRRAGLRARLETGEAWWEVSLAPMDDSQEQPELFLLEIHDQTQVFRLRQQAGKMLDRQRQLAEGIQDALILVDDTGHILQANKCAERLFSHQVSGNQLKTLIPELDQPMPDGSTLNLHQNGIDKILHAGREARYLNQPVSIYSRQGLRQFRIKYWQAVSGESWLRLEPVIEQPQDMHMAAELLHMRMIRDILLREHDRLDLTQLSSATQQDHRQLCQLAGKLTPQNESWSHGHWSLLRMPELSGMAAEVLSDQSDVALELELNLDFSAVTLKLVDSYLIQTLQQLRHWLLPRKTSITLSQVQQDCFYGIEIKAHQLSNKDLPYWLENLMETLVVQLHQGSLELMMQEDALVIRWLFIVEARSAECQI